jgi:hypothetical protein
MAKRVLPADAVSEMEREFEAVEVPERFRALV